MNPERAAALALVAEVGVSEAARRTGESKTTLHRWAKAAGIRTGPGRNGGTERNGTKGAAPAPGAKGSGKAGDGRGEGGKPPPPPRRPQNTRAQVAADLDKPGALDEYADLEGRSWSELATIAITRNLRDLARGDIGKGQQRALTVAILVDKRTAIAALEKADAAPTPEETAATEAPDPSTPEGRAALLAELAKVPAELLEEARRMQGVG